MSINSDEVNVLVYRYLQESGFTHTAYSFACESLVMQSGIQISDVQPGSLVSYLIKGLQYTEIETHLKSDGTTQECNQPFSLIGEHVCTCSKQPIQENELIEEEVTLTPINLLAKSNVLTLANHNGETYSIQWTPNGDMLASCSEDSFVIIWNIPNGNCCEEKNNDIKSECIRLHAPNVSSTIANNQHNFNQIKEKPWIPYVIRWSRTGEDLVACYNNGQMRVWDNSGEVKSDLKSHTSQVICLEYCEDNHFMASGGSDNKLIIWNTDNYTIYKTFEIINNNNVMEIEGGDNEAEGDNNNTKNDEILDIAWKNSNSLLCCSSKGNIYYFKMSEDNAVVVVKNGHNKDINEIAWNKDKSIFATCSDDGKVKLWKEEEEEEKEIKSENNKIKVINTSTLDGHSGIVYTMKWSYSIEHSNLLASCSNDSNVIVWNTLNNSMVYKFEHHSDCIYGLSWNYNGTCIASGSLDGITYVWNATTGEIYRGYKEAGVYETEWSCASHKIASCHCNGLITIMDEPKFKN